MNSNQAPFSEVYAVVDKLQFLNSLLVLFCIFLQGIQKNCTAIYTYTYVIHFYVKVQRMFTECQLCARHVCGSVDTVGNKLSASKEHTL